MVIGVIPARIGSTRFPKKILADIKGKPMIAHVAEKALKSNLLDKVILRGADGIDIDFELVPSSQRENLVIFMEELSQAFHQSLDNPIITMATPAVDWSK